MKLRRQISSLEACCIALCFVLSGSWASAAEKQPHAGLSVSGYGLSGDFELKRTLRTLDLNWKKRAFFDANFIEDAALMLFSRLHRDGYLHAEILVTLGSDKADRQTITWRDTIEPPLHRPMKVREVHFQINKGIRYRYDEIRFEGLHALSSKEASAFFVGQTFLVPVPSARTYTPEKLRNSIDNLTEVLERRGFEHPEIVATNLVVNDTNGKVGVTIKVAEGPKALVRSVRNEVYLGTNANPVEVTIVSTNVPFSRLWQQDYAQKLKTTHLHEGYPDTSVEILPLRRRATNDIVDIEVAARVRPGKQVRLHDVRFEGLKKTKRSVVNRQAKLHEGDLLDRIEVEQGRYRLARLGIFDSVGLRYDVVDEHRRDVVYELKEAKQLNVNLLFGYGSYELARAGVELEQANIWGRAHHSRLRAVQSIKSTTADYQYTIPQFFGEDVDFFLNGSYLQRQEVDFVREEYGGGAGVRTFLKAISSDVSARYNYQILSATRTEAIIGPTNAAVGSVLFDLKHDQRDSPLYPHRGYKVASSFELASAWLGGDVDYWRFESQASYHHPITGQNWLHLAASHGFVFTANGPEEDLPFNKRFFPGGESSIRGFQFGEAAPRNARGKIIGAETYASGNLEFEQAITDKLSFVAFTDAIGFARDIGDYPFNEFLLSVGGGFGWKTIVGPIRLEYGYNVLRRSHDPIGTLQFSIGFPF